MALPDSWHIKSRAHECSVTAKPFEEDEIFFTALFRDPESEGYLRKDYSEAAWSSRDEEADKPFSFWRSVYKPPEVVAKADTIEQDNPEALLSRLVEEDEEHTENARYILAVMLERKKLLVETDSQKAKNGLLRIYQHRHTGEVFIVKDPQIPLSEVASIQEEVQALLAPKKPEPEPETEAEAENAPEGEAAPEADEPPHTEKVASDAAGSETEEE